MHNICWWYQLLWFNWAAAVRCLITSCSCPELWNCNKWNIKNEITRWLWEQISVLNFTKRSWDKEKTNYKGRSAYKLYKAQCYFAISDKFQDFFHFRAESAFFRRLVRLFLWWSIIQKNIYFYSASMKSDTKDFYNVTKHMSMFLLCINSISEWFLKDHATLKTGVMILKIKLCHHRNKLHF